MGRRVGFKNNPPPALRWRIFIVRLNGMTRSRIFLMLLIGFIAGIGMESFITVPIIMVLGIGLIAISVLAYGLSRKKKHPAIAAFVILACATGIVRMQYATRQAPHLDTFSQRYIAVIGTVAEDPRFTEKSQIVLLNVKEIGHMRVSSPTTISVLLRKYPTYQRGDHIAVQGMFEARLYNGVTAGTLFSAKEEKGGEEDMGFFRWIDASKQAFNAHIDAALPEPHASFMKGLLLGERASMPADLLGQFRLTGTSHIIALSGYNITLVGTFLVNALLILTVPFRLTFWIAGSSIVLFVLLTGAQASLIRAAIMGILILVAAREGRMYHMANALVFAGMVMLAIDPYLLGFDVGFQLSFLAALGLIYLADPIHRALVALEYNARLLARERRIPQEKEHPIATGVKKIMSETIAAQLAVMPLLVYQFGGVSLIAPISNLFILAAIPSAMAFGFLAGMAGFIWQPISTVAGWCAWMILQYELSVIDFFSKISFSFVSVSFAGEIFIIIAYGIAGVIWWKKKYKARMDNV